MISRSTFPRQDPASWVCTEGGRGGKRKREGERNPWLGWCEGEGKVGGRCPASWGWGEALSSPVCRAAHTEKRCEKSHYPAGKYLMDHRGGNAKASREREGGKGQAIAAAIPVWEGKGSFRAGAGSRCVCELSCASPEGWVQAWGAFSSPQHKISEQCLAEVSGCCRESDGAQVRAEEKRQRHGTLVTKPPWRAALGWINPAISDSSFGAAMRNCRLKLGSISWSLSALLLQINGLGQVWTLWKQLLRGVSSSH